MEDAVTDPVRFALEQLQAYGFKIDVLQLGAPPNGKAHRLPHNDDKSGKKSCWYIAHLIRLNDGREAVVGAYGRFVGAENFREKFELPEKAKLSESDRLRIRLEQKRVAEEAEAARDEAAQDAARSANEIWPKLPSCSDSPYLTRKGVAAYGLGRGRDQVAVVPMRTVAGALIGLQFIQPDGEKRFLTGQRTTGSYHLIGTVSEERPLVLAEGYATAASCHMATTWPAVVCFDAGNLPHVAQVLRLKYPGVQFIVAGDDDHEKKENAGRKAAPVAAERCRGQVVFPQFKDPRGKKDFNDLHAAEGLDAVATQLRQAFTPLVQADAGDQRQPWRRELVWGDDGLKVTKHNLILILENDPAWEGVLAYDEFARQVVKRKPPPYSTEAGAMGDHDDAEVAAWFERKDTYRLSVPTTISREAVVAVAHRHRFHPVRDYLEALRWDQEDRIPTFFEKYCGVRVVEAGQPDQEHTVPREVIKKFALNFFIAAVARIFKPGCKADLMLVLECEQWTKKSSLVELLAGWPQFYVDLGTSPADKDFYQIIQGRWLVEISELASFAKADTSHIKRAVSSHTDTFRPSYARYVQQFPRECLFMGTANDADWSRDPTGGRRFMPIWVHRIDFDGVRAIRDQLWAEAVYRFKDGEEWWHLPPLASLEQEARYTEDPWTEPIGRWLSSTDSVVGPVSMATAAEIMDKALHIETKKQDRIAQRMVGEIMRRLGWKRKQKRIGNSSRSRVWVYERPADSEVSSA
jgi:putative DNA primase/helicase